MKAFCSRTGRRLALAAPLMALLLYACGGSTLIPPGPTVTFSGGSVTAAVQGQSWPAFTFQMESASGMPLTDSGVSVLLVLVSGSGSLGGTLEVFTTNGAASFTGITYDTREGITIGVELDGNPVFSFDVTVTGPPSQLAFRSSPSSAQVNEVLSFVAVEVRDSSGDQVLADNSTQVVISLEPGPSGTLSGTLSQTAEGGVAVFSDLRHDTAESITLGAIDMGATLVDDTSDPISIEDGPADASPIERVNLSTTDGEATAASKEPVLSQDGRFAVFESLAALSPVDTNGVLDVYLRDRIAGTTELISIGTGGTAGNGAACYPAISADGRYVAFNSFASNMGGTDANGAAEIFVRDRHAAMTKRITTTPAGAESDATSDFPEMSADGRYIVYHSLATNLVPGDTNGTWDAFFHDQVTGVTERMSIATDGTEGTGGTTTTPVPDVSDDGRYVAFTSGFTNLVADDTNGHTDIFVRDRLTGTTVRASVSSAGAQAIGGDSRDVALSGNGQYVAFGSTASNLVPDDTNDDSDIFLRDLLSNMTTRISVDSSEQQVTSAMGSVRPSISEDGNLIVFESDAADLVTGDTNGTWDNFVRDVGAGMTYRVSVTSAGAQANNTSNLNYISPDGRFVAFESLATNLVGSDTNNQRDIFVAPFPPP